MHTVNKDLLKIINEALSDKDGDYETSSLFRPKNGIDLTEDAERYMKFSVTTPTLPDSFPVHLYLVNVGLANHEYFGGYNADYTHDDWAEVGEVGTLTISSYDDDSAEYQGDYCGALGFSMNDVEYMFRNGRSNGSSLSWHFKQVYFVNKKDAENYADIVKQCKKNIFFN